MQIDLTAASGSAMPPEVGAIGPAWTRGEIEKPAGTKDMGGWTAGATTSAPPPHQCLNLSVCLLRIRCTQQSSNLA